MYFSRFSKIPNNKKNINWYYYKSSLNNALEILVLPSS